LSDLLRDFKKFTALKILEKIKSEPESRREWMLERFYSFTIFPLFHVPDAMANPTVDGGNGIVRALICLLFCGIALVIALQMILKQKPQENKFPAALLL
jgi:hypothetical protein